MLVGPLDLIDEARIWQHRMGQRLYRQFPYVLAALRGLAINLPRMAVFVTKAAELAAAANKVQGVSVQPDPPPTNAFLVTMAGNPSRVQAARLKVARECHLWLFDYAPPSVAGTVTFEVHIRNAGLTITSAQLQQALRIFRAALLDSVAPSYL